MVDIIESEKDWTLVTSNTFYRTWNGFVYKMELSQSYIGGSRTWRIPLGTLLSKEWIGR